MTDKGNLEYDVLNVYEAISIVIQWSLNLLLLIRGFINILNIPRWQKEKKIKVNKLYCININCMVVIISNPKKCLKYLYSY